MAASTDIPEAIDTFYDVWNSGEVDRFDDYFAPDVRYHIQGFPDMDLAGFKQFVGAVRVSQPDFSVSENERIVAGDRASSRWTATATFATDSPLLPGVTPTGKKQTTWGLVTYRWEGGKVVEVWHAVDLLGWWTQQGVIPPLPTP